MLALEPVNSVSHYLRSDVKQLNHWTAQLVKNFLPRGRSKGYFVFAILCYEITLSAFEQGIINVLRLWPTAFKVIQPGLPRIPTREQTLYLAAAVLLGPIGESMIIIAVIEIFRRLRFGVVFQIVASLSLICILHSTEYAFFGLLAAPFFLADIGTYLYWRRESFWAGTWMMIILHSAYNAIIALRVVGQH